MTCVCVLFMAVTFFTDFLASPLSNFAGGVILTFQSGISKVGSWMNVRSQELKTIRDIAALGLSNFMMSITNSIVQVVCNSTLSLYGGDLYVGVMTVINSVREIVSMPVSGITNGSQPVISFNYGAEKYDRIKTAIRFMAVSCIAYTTAIWGILHLFPVFFIHIFNTQADLVEAAVPSMQIYYFGFFMMSLQFSGQTVFQALGKAKYAIFFSILRKVVIVAPLTILLPRWISPSVNGVFLAEPISNFIGGTACFVTMLIVVGRELKAAQKEQDVMADANIRC